MADSLPRPADPARFSRRAWLVGATSLSTGGTLSGCVPVAAGGSVDLVWGRRGWSDGRFLKPRAIAIDPDDRLYIVDTTGRIQVFDVEGEHLLTWSMPDTTNGRPTGLSFQTATDPEQSRLIVADTHYYRVMVFDPSGQLDSGRQLGGTAGSRPGEFAFVTDAVCDSKGCLYVGEYGDNDRIQKFSPDGEFLTQWGKTGSAPGDFLRPQSLVVDGQTLWVVDACNHRIQSFDISVDEPRLIDVWGREGQRAGEFYYPYDLAIDQDGSVVVCEYGNQRLQRLTRRGESLSSWGSPGHEPAQLYQPWGLVIDSRRRIHVLDSNNHRVQRLAAGAM